MDRHTQRQTLRYYSISPEEVAKKVKTSPRTVYRFYEKKEIDERYLTNRALYECINQIIKRKVWEMKKERK